MDTEQKWSGATGYRIALEKASRKEKLNCAKYKYSFQPFHLVQHPNLHCSLSALLKP